jgi:hypothetical protein
LRHRSGPPSPDQWRDRRIGARIPAQAEIFFVAPLDESGLKNKAATTSAFLSAAYRSAMIRLAADSLQKQQKGGAGRRAQTCKFPAEAGEACRAE